MHLFLLDNKKKGFYLYSSESKSIQKDVIKCSLFLTVNFPIAQTIFYCNNSTTEEEITSFSYKSIKCDYNVLFILIKPEILSKYISKLTELISCNLVKYIFTFLCILFTFDLVLIIGD